MNSRFFRTSSRADIKSITTLVVPGRLQGSIGLVTEVYYANTAIFKVDLKIGADVQRKIMTVVS